MTLAQFTGLIRVAGLPLLVTVAAAQSLCAGEWTFGLGGGTLLPAGSWADHPFAAETRLFSPSWSMSAEFAFHTGERFSVALVGSYGRFSTGAWEEYAGTRGAAVEASAWMGTLMVGLRPRIWSAGGSAVTLELGGGLLFSGGKESANDRSVEYSFLPKTASALSAGLEVEHRLSPSTALFLRGAYIASLAGIRYGDGAESPLSAVPLLLGVRWNL